MTDYDGICHLLNDKFCPLTGFDRPHSRVLNQSDNSRRIKFKIFSAISASCSANSALDLLLTLRTLRFTQRTPRQASFSVRMTSMKMPRPGRIIPSPENALLALVSAVMLTLAFPNFEFWYLAWFALIPLMWAIEREKLSTAKSFVIGWLFGTIFFYGTCWWLTFAPITYAGFPAWLAYSLMFGVSLAVGLFPAVFAALLSILLRRFGSIAILGAPFIWIVTEFLRYWLTGNNWNAIGYSQAFRLDTVYFASLGGVHLVGFLIALFNAFMFWSNYRLITSGQKYSLYAAIAIFWISFAFVTTFVGYGDVAPSDKAISAKVVAIQPNVPMSGLDSAKLEKLRQRQIDLAEVEIKKLNEQRTSNNEPILVILPESPMDFAYHDDREFQKFINGFARRNNVSVLFNSAEPDKGTPKYFNSAVMVGPQGSEVAEYDKIFLLPFGEAVPPMLEGIVPGFVGNFAYGRKYDLMPIGDAKAGVMICFESHFGELSRHYAANGADVIIEMTNDGYLGPTPVLRQHLANAVFRAVEINRPVLRVTNVGITAYISENGTVLDATQPYQEDTRVWSVSKSDGSQTFYVKYGDWFAWVCSAVTIGLLIFSFRKRRSGSPTATNNIA